MQQVVELKLKDSTFQKFNKVVKEKNIELIVENGIDKEMVIIDNILEDSIKVKYENESTIHNPHVSLNLLKITTS